MVPCIRSIDISYITRRLKPVQLSFLELEVMKCGLEIVFLTLPVVLLMKGDSYMVVTLVLLRLTALQQ